MNVSEEDYIEVAEEEVQGIVKESETIAKLDTLEVIDEISYTTSVIPKVINSIPMTNNQSLERKSLFPLWSADSVPVKKGEKYQLNGKLYEVVQDHTTQANWSPESQSSLWVEVVEDHDGTLEDPIPYNEAMNPMWTGMILYNGKYYTQAGVIYKCTRDSGIKLTQSLEDLVGTYVELIEQL